MIYDEIRHNSVNISFAKGRYDKYLFVNNKLLFKMLKRIKKFFIL